MGQAATAAVCLWEIRSTPIRSTPIKADTPGRNVGVSGRTGVLGAIEIG